MGIESNIEEQKDKDLNHRKTINILSTLISKSDEQKSQMENFYKKKMEDEFKNNKTLVNKILKLEEEQKSILDSKCGQIKALEQKMRVVQEESSYYKKLYEEFTKDAYCQERLSSIHNELHSLNDHDNGLCYEREASYLTISDINQSNNKNYDKKCNKYRKSLGKTTKPFVIMENCNNKVFTDIENWSDQDNSDGDKNEDDNRKTVENSTTVYQSNNVDKDNSLLDKFNYESNDLPISNYNQFSEIELSQKVNAETMTIMTACDNQFSQIELSQKVDAGTMTIMTPCDSPNKYDVRISEYNPFSIIPEDENGPMSFNDTPRQATETSFFDQDIFDKDKGFTDQKRLCLDQLGIATPLEPINPNGPIPISYSNLDLENVNHLEEILNSSMYFQSIDSNRPTIHYNFTDKKNCKDIGCENLQHELGWIFRLKNKSRKDSITVNSNTVIVDDQNYCVNMKVVESIDDNDDRGGRCSIVHGDNDGHYDANMLCSDRNTKNIKTAVPQKESFFDKWVQDDEDFDEDEYDQQRMRLSQKFNQSFGKNVENVFDADGGRNQNYRKKKDDIFEQNISDDSLPSMMKSPKFQTDFENMNKKKTNLIEYQQRFSKKNAFRELDRSLEQAESNETYKNRNFQKNDKRRLGGCDKVECTVF